MSQITIPDVGLGSTVDQSLLAQLKQGSAAWNEWRSQNMEVWVDFCGVDFRGFNLRDADLRWIKFSGANLSGVNLNRANLRWTSLDDVDFSRAGLQGANLSWADLTQADLSWADLREANLNNAELTHANFKGANLKEANLQEVNCDRTSFRWANLTGADLREAHLQHTDLTHAQLITANCEKAKLIDCAVYGLTAENLKLSGATQSHLVITPEDEPAIAADSLEVVQFLYQLLNNQNALRPGRFKVVLILGDFVTDQQSILQALSDGLRQRGYTPVVFDCKKLANRDTIERVCQIARIARFVVADLSNPPNVLRELQRLVPDLPLVPVQPLRQVGGRCQQFDYFGQYRSVLALQQYEDIGELLISLDSWVTSAEAKAKELLRLT